jgi:hypothetical protein
LAARANKHILAGLVLAGFGFFGFGVQHQFFKQHLAQLLWRCDVEPYAGFLKHGFLQLGNNVGFQYFREFFQRIVVNAYALVFNIGQYVYQRVLNFVQQFFGLYFFYLGSKMVLSCRVISASSAAYSFIFSISTSRMLPWFLPLGPIKLGNGNGFIVQVIFRQDIHAVAGIRINHVVRHHGIKQVALYLHIIPFQHQDIELEVLPGFANVRVFQHRFKFSDYLRDLCLIVQVRVHTSLVVFYRERQAHQLALVGIGAGGFGIKAKMLFAVSVC